MLYKNRKFDIRMWVLLTPKKEVFFYKKGYLRTSSEIYNPKSKDPYVHLTNNCLQQFGHNYSQFEEGNTVPLEHLQDYINDNYTNLDVDVDKYIIAKMKDIVIDTYLSIEDTEINPENCKPRSFELLGYDFLIDEDLKVWLLEVKSNFK